MTTEPPAMSSYVSRSAALVSLPPDAVPRQSPTSDLNLSKAERAFARSALVESGWPMTPRLGPFLEEFEVAAQAVIAATAKTAMIVRIDGRRNVWRIMMGRLKMTDATRTVSGDLSAAAHAEGI